jgi:excisionase family DNA binding protein
MLSFRRCQETTAKEASVEERRLSLSEAADALDISERTAYRWVKSGKLRAYKPGRDYWIPESAVTEIIEKSLVRPKVTAPPSSPQLSLNHELEEERRASEYRRWADFVNRCEERWKPRIESGNLNPWVIEEFAALLADLGPIISQLGLREKQELDDPEYIHTYGPIMSGVLQRLLELGQDLINASVAQFDASQLEQLRRMRDELKPAHGEAGRRPA